MMSTHDPVLRWKWWVVCLVSLIGVVAVGCNSAQSNGEAEEPLVSTTVPSTVALEDASDTQSTTSSTSSVSSTSSSTTTSTTSSTTTAPLTIDHALRTGDAQALEVLIGELGLETVPEAALIDAIIRDDIEVMIVLLNAGMDPSLPLPDDRGPDQENRRPIHFATSVEALEVLVGAGADINAVSQLGAAVVRNALSWGRTDLVFAALELGAEPIDAAFDAVSLGDAVVLEWIFSNYDVSPATPPRPGTEYETILGLTSLQDLAELLGDELDESVAQALEAAS